MSVQKQQNDPIKILVVRPDRIGDVILSTPVFEALKRHFPRSHLTVMVQAPIVPLIQGLPFVDEVMVFDPLGAHRGTGGFFRLMSEIREARFKIAVVLQSNRRIAAALFGSAVPHRVGPLSKIHSFFFYNRGVRQRRSHVEMHETDYNLQLLRRLGVRIATRSIPVRVHLADEAREWARAWLKENGRDFSAQLVIVHPGMSGSALNWPENQYVELIRGLIKEGKQVLVTGGPNEEPLLRRFQALLTSHMASSKVLFYGGERASSLDQFAGLMSHADLVIAPSTGPLHIAVALGKPVVTFYSPIRVQSAIRWGPYVKDDEKASILVPEVYCGQEFKCLGNVCNYFPCMKSLTVPQVLGEAYRQLTQASALGAPNG